MRNNFGTRDGSGGSGSNAESDPGLLWATVGKNRRDVVKTPTRVFPRLPGWDGDGGSAMRHRGIHYVTAIASGNTSGPFAGANAVVTTPARRH
jgi:hypothetical protein